jgi:iron complex outermembrane receptor protein
MKFLLIITLVFVCFSSPGQKADTSSAVGTLSPDSLRISESTLPEIPVTAFRTAGLLKSVAGSVSVVTTDRLEISAVNIASSLATVPGLVMQEGTLGTIKLTLRGIGSRYPYGTKKIKLFFGDIPMYSAEGETTFDDINPDYISSIEVLRGPASSIHGASLGGTLILSPVRSGINREEVGLISSAGSYGYFKNGISYAQATAKSDLLLSVSGIQSEGYRENSKYSRSSFFINNHQTLSKTLSGNLVVSGSKIGSQIPSSIDSATFAAHPRKAAATWLKTKGYEHPERIFAGYSLLYKRPEKLDFSASVFLNSRKTEENRPFNFMDEHGVSYGGRILVQYSMERRGSTCRFSAGSNIFLENIRSSLSENRGGNGIKKEVLQDGQESLYQTDLFAQLEIRRNRMAITGGVNYNRSGFLFTDLFDADTLQQSGNYHFAPIIAPRVALTWNPMTDLYLYTSVNKGFSTPSLTETLSPLGLINRAIKPEKAWSYEVGIRANLFGRATFVDLAMYYMEVTDLIVPQRVAEEIYVGMNAGSSIHKGAEIAMQQWIIGRGNISSDKRLTLKANLAYALNRFNFQEFIQDNSDFSGKKLPGMPDQLFSGSLDLKLPEGFYTRFELNSSGRIPLNDANSQFATGWVVMNLKAGYIFKLIKNLNIDATVKINNLTNEKYASMVVVNAPGTAARPPRYFYPGLPGWVTCTLKLNYRLIRSKEKS